MKNIITGFCFVIAINLFSQSDSTQIIKKDSIPEIKKETLPVLNNVSNPGDPKPQKKYSPISFGPRIGVGIGMLAEDNLYGRMWRPVLNAGGFFNYQFNKYFSASTEIYFTQYAKNYQYTNKSNLIPKMINNMYLFGVDSFLVDLLASAITSTATTIHDTIYSHTKGTVKMSALEMPLFINFHFKNFKISAGAYASYRLKAVSSEEYKDDCSFLDLLGPTIDTLLNQALGGIPGFSPYDFIVAPAVPNYKKSNTGGSSSLKNVPDFTFGFIADLGYIFSNNVGVGLRINYPWMTYQPNVNVSYVRNTQYSASLSYYFRLNKRNKGQKTKSVISN